MANRFHLEIIVPTSIYFNDDVDSVSVVTSDGVLTILAEHADLIANIEISHLVIRQNGHLDNYAVSGGVLNIYQKETGHLARKFLLDRFGLTKVEELLKRHVYRQQHAFAPEPKPTLTEQQTRLCEIAAGLNQIGQLEMRLSVMVQKAIEAEPYLQSTSQNNK